jgi:hypothetical protein
MTTITAKFHVAFPTRKICYLQSPILNMQRIGPRRQPRPNFGVFSFHALRQIGLRKDSVRSLARSASSLP